MLSDPPVFEYTSISPRSRKLVSRTSSRSWRSRRRPPSGCPRIDRAGARRPPEPLPGHFEQEPLLRVHAGPPAARCRRNAGRSGRSPRRSRPKPRRVRLRAPRSAASPIHRRSRFPAAAEPVRRLRSAGKPAADADQGDRFRLLRVSPNRRSCVPHVRVPGLDSAPAECRSDHCGATPAQARVKPSLLARVGVEQIAHVEPLTPGSHGHRQELARPAGATAPRPTRRFSAVVPNFVGEQRAVLGDRSHALDTKRAARLIDDADGCYRHRGACHSQA